MENTSMHTSFKDKDGVRIKHLVVLAHPEPKSLSGAYKDEIVRLTEDTGNEVIVRDLYNLGFHPVLSAEDFGAFKKGEVPADIQLEQDYIRCADLITFIYPIWWTGMPAMMKGYIDRVFSRGFAYDITGLGEIKKLLTGKKIILLNNFGMAYDEYEKTGMLDALRKTSDTGIFEFCGMEVQAHHFFGHMDNSSKEERSAHLQTLSYLYEKFLPSKPDL